MEAHPEKRQTILQAREMILLLKSPKIIVQPEEQEASLARILKKERSAGYTEVIGQPEHSGKLVTLKTLYRMAAVITLLVLGSIGIIYLTPENPEQQLVVQVPAMLEKSNPAGQKLSLKLPDGSQVFLNAESSIRYPENFSDSMRSVQLVGEAYFKVEKDGRPFLVETGIVTTRVLGTSFNVNAYPEQEQISIALFEGKVQVITGEEEANDSIFLAPEEKLVVHRQTLDTRLGTFDPLAEGGWKDGILVFEGDNLESVVQKLERWYGVQIETQNKPGRDWQLRGRFRDLSLQQLLDNLKFTNKIDYEMNGKQIRLIF